VASRPVLDQAFQDVCAKRLASHPNDDIWHLRCARPTQRARLLQALQAGTYSFSPPHLVSLTLPDKLKPELVERWDAQDTVVHKAMAHELGPRCAQAIPRSVTSLRHRGGPKGAVRRVCHHLKHSPGLTRVMPTDTSKGRMAASRLHETSKNSSSHDFTVFTRQAHPKGIWFRAAPWSSTGASRPYSEAVLSGTENIYDIIRLAD
jgi:hypothetical protein